MKQLALPLETRAALGREDFVVAPANSEAVAFIDSYPHWPVSAAALYGPSGSGKSHLAAAWAARAQARIVSASALAEVAAVEGAVSLAVEDIDTTEPDAARDAIIFALLERGGAILLTGREKPATWRATMPDLESRYRSLLAFALWEPDDEVLGALARKLFADRQLAVPDAVIAEMLRSLERSPAAVRDFVALIDARALSEKRRVSLALMRSILQG